MGALCVAQLFSKALSNLGIIMGTTALCLIVQCVLLVLDFAFGIREIKFSNVSFDLLCRLDILNKFRAENFYKMRPFVDNNGRFYSSNHSGNVIHDIYAGNIFKHI